MKRFLKKKSLFCFQIQLIFRHIAGATAEEKKNVMLILKQELVEWMEEIITSKPARNMGNGKSLFSILLLQIQLRYTCCRYISPCTQIFHSFQTTIALLKTQISQIKFGQ